MWMTTENDGQGATEMANHYYGFAWSFGIGVVNAGTGEWLGVLMIFDSVQGHNAWIACDTDNRERIDSKSARHEMVRLLHRLGYTRLLDKYDSRTGIERWCPIDELIDAYREATR